MSIMQGKLKNDVLMSGGLLGKEDRSACRKEPQYPVLWVWLETYCIPRRYHLKNKTKHILVFIFCLSVFLLAQYPKRFRKNSCCGPLVAEHPERWQNCFKFLALKSAMRSVILVIWESKETSAYFNK